MKYLMNSATGSVDTEENWLAEMSSWEGDQKAQFDSLIEVEKINGDWVEGKLTERANMLINNGLDWYVVTLEDGSYEVMHSTSLSAIIECGEPQEEYGYTAIERCWGGEDLTTEDDWI